MGKHKETVDRYKRDYIKGAVLAHWPYFADYVGWKDPVRAINTYFQNQGDFDAVMVAVSYWKDKQEKEALPPPPAPTLPSEINPDQPDRMQTVLLLGAAGYTAEQILEELGLSRRTLPVIRLYIATGGRGKPPYDGLIDKFVQESAGKANAL